MSFLRETVGWTCAACLTAAAHAGVAHWALSRPLSPIAPPAPVVVELVAAPPASEQPEAAQTEAAQPEAAQAEAAQPAPEPSATETPTPEPPTPGPPTPAADPAPEPIRLEDAPVAAPQDVAPPLVLPDLQPLEPVADFAAVIPPPAQVELPAPTILPPVEDFAALIAPATTLTRSSRPAPRPARPTPEPAVTQAKAEKPVPAEKETPRREARKAAPASPARADNRVEPARRAANDGRGKAREAPAAAGQGGVNPQALQKWHARVGAQITRHMSRTRVNGGEAQVQIAVTVSPNGAATGRLARSSGDARIDAALSRQAARLPRMQPPPSGRAESFVLPIRVTR